MKLKSFTITNYRSIKKAYNIPLNEDMTILIGKNNEGKSNILRALSGAFYIIKLLRNVEVGLNLDSYIYGTRRHRLGGSYNVWDYDWQRDFPISKQYKSTRGTTKFRLVFSLTTEEQTEFYEVIKHKFNKTLPIEVILGKEHISIDIPKRSRGSSNKIFKNKINSIAKYVSEHIDSIYIPAIRPAELSVEIIETLIDRTIRQAITKDPKFAEAQKMIDSIIEDSVKNLSLDVSDMLKTFIPNIQNVEIETSTYSRFSRRFSPDIRINDGTITSIHEKGDGLKSLIALSLMQGTHSNDKSRTIAVEEPESHLHPESIRRVREILYNISQTNQIIVSTHSPIFVNSQKLSSNIIVRNNKAEPVENIRQIREELGIAVSDNLYNAENILLVEGTSDVRAITRLLCLSSQRIKSLIKDGVLAIKAIGGVHNLDVAIMNYQNLLCKNIFVYIDNDNEANIAKNKVFAANLINEQYLLQTAIQNKEESEFEDLVSRDLYNEIFTEPSLQNWCDAFNCKKYKWSENLKKYYENGGITLTEKRLAQIKEEISKKIEDAEENILIEENSSSFNALIRCIENTIKE